MSALFLGNHPAIDFLNTAYAPDGQVTETIGDGTAFMDWMIGAGLLQESMATTLRRKFGRGTLDAVASEARRMREWAREWLSRWRAEPHANYRKEIEILNEILARIAMYPKVTQTREGLRIVDQDRLESVNTLLALIARAVATLVSEEQPSLVKSCAGASCTLWFLDRTKGHRRIFCSATGCGNRAKVAAFRERQRT